MRVVMYAPGGGRQGVGHTMRAIALAEQAMAHGWEVLLAGRLEGAAADQANQLLALELADVMGPEGLAALAAGADVLHLDSYQHELSGVPWDVSLVSCMADGEFGLRPADLVIDTSFSAPRRQAQIIDKSGALPLVGPMYSPVRQRVRALRNCWDRGHAEQRRILVVMGGTDPQELTLPVVRQLSRFPGLDITVVTDLDRHDAVRQVWTSTTGHVRTVSFLDDLILEACQHDLVITAAGTSVWEFACAGVPMGLVCAVDNQQDNFDTVVEAGAAVGLTDSVGVLTDFSQSLLPLFGSRETLEELSRVAARHVDGDGAWRIVTAWESLAGLRPSPANASNMQARLADDADAGLLLSWRNDKASRFSSRDPSVIASSQHMDWFARVTRDPARHLLLVADRNSPVGTVRWERSQGETYEEAWEVSITVAPEHRGRGLSLGVLRAGEEWLCSQEVGALRLVAYVHESNAASIGLFKRAGYIQDMRPDDDGFLRFSRPGASVPTAGPKSTESRVQRSS